MDDFSFEDPASALANIRDSLAEVMASEQASAEILAAMGHVDAALRDLRIRDTRLADEQERDRIEQEALQNGTYDTFDDDPRDAPPE